MYLDTLMNRGMAMDWGICGVGLQPANARMRDVMTAQDGLYTLNTLVIRNRDGSWDARVIGSIVEFLYAAILDRRAGSVVRPGAAAGRISSG